MIEGGHETEVQPIICARPKKDGGLMQSLLLCPEFRVISMRTKTFTVTVLKSPYMNPVMGIVCILLHVNVNVMSYR